MLKLLEQRLASCAALSVGAVPCPLGALALSNIYPELAAQQIV